MPKITRIRIANFQYNNEKRWILDELYDLSDDEGHSGVNTLIALMNGGGKTVLTHLMLQPILPGAKVAKRRIEDFFTKASCHCFVLLEWQKDYSAEKLLTGIAMAASESSGQNENVRGKTMRYYTFYANYEDERFPYSIANLPLSRNENGRFVAVEYEYVRKTAEKSGGVLQCYSSEQDKDWKWKLEEYGIFQEVWRNLMEPLNSDENGMSQYFAKFKTSDRLINNLLIPVIESRLGQRGDRNFIDNEDSSLATMLLQYVKQYQEQTSKLTERERCETFLQDIQLQQRTVQELWNLWDERAHIVRDLFGFSDALRQAISERKARKQTLEERLKALDDKRRHIDWEEASEDFYTRQQDAERLQAEWKAAKDCLEQLDAQRKQAEKHRDILQAAKCARKLRSLRNELESLNESIADKRKGEDAAIKTQNKLGASVLAALSAVLPEQRAACQEADAKLQEARDALAKAQETFEAAERQERECASAKDRADGRYTTICSETDRLVGELQINAMRNFFNHYVAEDIEDAGQSQQERLRDAEAKLQQIKDADNEAAQVLAEIPGKIAACQIRQADAERQRDKCQTELDKYSELEGKMREICRLHSLDFATRFSDAVPDYLRHKGAEIQAEIAEKTRKKALLREELAAAKAGTVHVPKAVMEYLDGSRIRYQTCEKYLLTQIHNGNLSPEQCVDILEACPAAAYGIVTEERNLLEGEGRADWLPATLPVFTNVDMDNVLRKKMDRPADVCHFSVQSFLDRAEYAENLEENIQASEQDIAQKGAALRDLEEQLANAEAFSDYDADWLARCQKRLETLETECASIKKDVGNLEREREKQTASREAFDKARKEAERKIKNLENWLERFERLRGQLGQEDEAYQSRSKAQAAHSDSQDKLKDARNNLERTERKKCSCETEATSQRETLAKMEDARSDVQSCASEEIEPGSWTDLIEKYRAFLQREAVDLSYLEKEAAQKREAIREAESDLKRTGCTAEEYRDISYSDEDNERLNREISALDGKRKQAAEEERSRSDKSVKARSDFEHAQKALDEFGGQPLQKEEIGANYEKRRKDLASEKSSVKQEIKTLTEDLDAMNLQAALTEDKLKSLPAPEEYPPLMLQADIKEQWVALRDSLEYQEKRLSQGRRKLQGEFSKLENQYSSTSQGAFFASALDMLNSNAKGDIYYTLDERMDEIIHCTEMSIRQINTDLEDFDAFRQDLIRECCRQGELMYQGLTEMVKKARVKIHENKPSVEMIRFDLPKEVNASLAESAIADELETGTKELMEKMRDSSLSANDIEVRRMAEQIVSSASLLRKYVQKERISLKAYKVDASPEHGEYRTWEQTQIINSGAEKFLVYFSIILSIINYTKASVLGENRTTSVLILDNPFGVITSSHVLAPMFQVAEHFHVQLICLSDITKCDITSRFNTVIRAVVKEIALSSVSRLTHEGNERIEHGFYRATQISF